MPSGKWSRLLLFACTAALLGGTAGFLVWIFSDLPEVRTLETYAPLESSLIYSADGRLLAEFFLERRNYVPHYEIPERLKKAFIAIEDQRFYHHPGVDLIGILRALYRDILARSIVEGGSTITQQLTKMLFLKPDKSVSRKIREAIIAIQIEKRYTKDEILGMYLNQAYFGSRAYGIEAAAQTHFGKSIKELSLAEMALLASLPKAPSSYSPFKSPDKALARRDLVLRKMREGGVITSEEYSAARDAPLPQKPFFRNYEAPYFVEFLKQRLEAEFGDDIYRSGMKVFTTLDYAMQQSAEAAVKSGVSEIERRVRPPVQAALVAINPRTGHIKAMVGGTSFWDNQFNRATMALRQPGSAFKPFVFAAALQGGKEIDDSLIDSPISFKGASAAASWSPRNYNNEYHGVVTLKKALSLSLNSATVRLAGEIGLAEVIALARRCGIKSRLDPYMPLALGASDVTLLEITAAYSAFLTGGVPQIIAYDKILSRDGGAFREILPKSEEILSPDTVEGMKSMLRAVVESGTAQKAKELKRTVYGKTGTTNKSTDAWFIGFDEQLLVGVWVGRDDHTPIGPKEAGARAALPIWIEFMQSAGK